MKSTETIVKRIDHIMIKVVEAEYNRLFALFTETLQLPVAWEVNEDAPGFKTGGVFAGTINMEIFQSGTQQILPDAATRQAQLYGVAFEPYDLEAIVQEVDRRGIPHLPLMPVPEGFPVGTMGSMWTLLFFNDLLNNDLTRYGEVMKSSRDLTPFFNDLFQRGMIFLCEYNKQFYDTTQGRLRRRAEFVEARQGGPLGLLGVQEIVVGARDIAAARASWQRLFDPLAEVEEGRWEVGDGPAIRLVSHDQDELVRLVWKVVSLERAAVFLREQDLLGGSTAGQIMFDRAKLGGLDIQLVEL
jgi:hypothetical protein